jgi:hypothetical protein
VNSRTTIRNAKHSFKRRLQASKNAGRKVYTAGRGFCIARVPEISETGSAQRRRCVTRRATLVVLCALHFLCTPALPAQVQPKAESRTMGLAQVGSGLWSQAGRADLPISQVILVGNPVQVNLHFMSSAGSERVLGGKLENKDATSLHIKVMSSENADASGNVLIEYGARNSINVLFGSGLLDGQPFAVQFTRRTPLRLKAIAIGKGTLSQAGGWTGKIQWASLVEDSSLHGEVGFFLDSGEIRRVSGRVEGKAGSRNLSIRVANSGTGQASGILRIQLGVANRIASVDGDLTIDAHPVRIHFESKARP